MIDKSVSVNFWVIFYYVCNIILIQLGFFFLYLELWKSKLKKQNCSCSSFAIQRSAQSKLKCWKRAKQNWLAHYLLSFLIQKLFRLFLSENFNSNFCLKKKFEWRDCLAVEFFSTKILKVAKNFIRIQVNWIIFCSM